LAGHIATQFV